MEFIELIVDPIAVAVPDEASSVRTTTRQITEASIGSGLIINARANMKGGWIESAGGK